MNAMVLVEAGKPLRAVQLATPDPGSGQVLVRVAACGVCRTDLHVADGELNHPKLPLIPGHEIVGQVVKNGPRADRFVPGTRVGIPWLGWTCGECEFCITSRENLCQRALFTGYTLDGGYSDHVVADERFCFPIPGRLPDVEAAPLLCAGLIGYRCLTKAGDATRIGIYGFGAAAHIIAQVARSQGREVYAFTRRGDTLGQEFARSLGALWVGASGELPPKKLHAAIIFAPVGELVPLALQALEKGGRVVCGGIHMSDIPLFPYELLWGERSICSVANLTRRDGEEFFALVSALDIKTTVEPFPLSSANEALGRLRSGKIQGAAVLIPD